MRHVRFAFDDGTKALFRVALKEWAVSWEGEDHLEVGWEGGDHLEVAVAVTGSLVVVGIEAAAEVHRAECRVVEAAATEAATETTAEASVQLR